MAIAAQRITRNNTVTNRPVLDFTKITGGSWFNTLSGSPLSSSLGKALGSFLGGDKDAFKTLLGNSGLPTGLEELKGDFSKGIPALFPGLSAENAETLAGAVDYLATGDKTALIEKGKQLLGGIIPLPKDCSSASAHGTVLSSAGGSSYSDTLTAGAGVTGSLSEALHCGAVGLIGNVKTMMGDGPFFNGMVDGLTGDMANKGSLSGLAETTSASTLKTYQHTQPKATEDFLRSYELKGDVPPAAAAEKYDTFQTTMNNLNPTWAFRSGYLRVSEIKKNASAGRLLTAKAVGKTTPGVPVKNAEKAMYAGYAGSAQMG